MDASTQRRSPVVAAFLSGISPGLGQFYNGNRRKALLFAGGGILTGSGPLAVSRKT